ncbi:MAG TPA: hypothetical protein VFY89_00040, partial [Ktedonobacterales bacterium]
MPPIPWSVATYTSTWSMEENGVPFGDRFDVHITVRAANILLAQGAPSCTSTAGIGWTWRNAGGGNTIACASGGLAMRRNSSSIPAALLTSPPSGFSGDSYKARVHVHFTSASSSTFAGIWAHADGSAGTCGGIRFEINSSGTARLAEISASCQEFDLTMAAAPAALDYDVGLVITPSGATWSINGAVLGDGGITVTGGL